MNNFIYRSRTIVRQNFQLAVVSFQAALVTQPAKMADMENVTAITSESLDESLQHSIDESLDKSISEIKECTEKIVCNVIEELHCIKKNELTQKLLRRMLPSMESLQKKPRKLWTH